mgnify:CR=1 FL=1
MRWNDINQIVESLEDIYANEDIPEDDLKYLHEMILSIPEFEDHDREVSDDHLENIIEHWSDIRKNL